MQPSQDFVCAFCQLERLTAPQHPALPGKHTWVPNTGSGDVCVSCGLKVESGVTATENGTCAMGRAFCPT